jgi:hypothetical protein
LEAMLRSRQRLLELGGMSLRLLRHANMQLIQALPLYLNRIPEHRGSPQASDSTEAEIVHRKSNRSS